MLPFCSSFLIKITSLEDYYGTCITEQFIAKITSHILVLGARHSLGGATKEAIRRPLCTGIYRMMFVPNSSVIFLVGLIPLQLHNSRFICPFFMTATHTQSLHLVVISSTTLIVTVLELIPKRLCRIMQVDMQSPAAASF